MTTGVAFVLIALGGLVLGAILHGYMAKEGTATKSEIAGWVQELRGIVVTDAAAAKSRVEALATKLEAKL